MSNLFIHSVIMFPFCNGNMIYDFEGLDVSLDFEDELRLNWFLRCALYEFFSKKLQEK